MRIKFGCTRIVLVGRSRVYKIPNFTYSWQHFLKGLLANMCERDTWRWNSGKYESGLSCLLCPVIWGGAGGWILVMAKADMKRHEEEARAAEPNTDIYSAWKAAGFNGDDKADNYGYYEDRLVKIDYGQ